ncbi:MAG: DUF551 domain-containing protein [Pseudomonadota bacterium]|nr:DUF551 domain-containing protein [Pseudomonadota bacterium]
MNVELTRIAQKKLDQMGATVHGVLVKNQAGAWAAVSESGRVMWLDGFEGQTATDREDALDCALSGQSHTERLIDSVHAELCSMAYDLMLSHTISGEWPETEVDTKAKHDQLIALAGELRKPKAARAQPEPSSGVPEGYVLAPKSMNITQDDVGLIAMMTGWEDEDQSEAEGVLWFGLIEDDDGNRTHGLNISCSECMEEGAIQLVQFDDPVTVTATPTPEAGQSGGMPVARWNGYGSIENLNTYLLDNHWEQPVYLYIHPHTNQPGSGAGDGWISVGERWPDKTGHYCVALSDPDDIGWSTLVSWTALWNGDGFEDCDPVEDGQPVTHWMPMPQPPQQGGQRR